MRLSIEMEVGDMRGARLFVPIQFEVSQSATGARVRDAFEEAFISSGYRILRLTEPRLAEGDMGEVVRNEIVAYEKDKTAKNIEWSLVVHPTRRVATEEEPDSLREAIRTVRSPLRATILDGVLTGEAPSVVVKLT